MSRPQETRRRRSVRLASQSVVAERRPDGAILLRSPDPLPAYPRKLTERFDHWAAHAPERVFLAQRGPDGKWLELTYAQARSRARRVAQALLDRGLSAERPVAVLSGNDFEHALIELGALYAGVPYAPVSPAYSLLSKDFRKLRYAVDLVTPGLVYASDRAAFQAAVHATLSGVEVLYREDFHQLEKAEPKQVDEAHERVGPDTIAKFLFTSGSTGEPKAVINILRPESDPVLKEIGDALGRHPDWRVRIDGHTDAVGSAPANLELSRRRSEAVRTALVERYGVAPARLSARGHGATMPLDSNETAEGRARNRRVELVRE